MQRNIWTGTYTFAWIRIMFAHVEVDQNSSKKFMFNKYICDKLCHIKEEVRLNNQTFLKLRHNLKFNEISTLKMSLIASVQSTNKNLTSWFPLCPTEILINFCSFTFETKLKEIFQIFKFPLRKYEDFWWIVMKMFGHHQRKEKSKF